MVYSKDNILWSTDDHTTAHQSYLYCDLKSVCLAGLALGQQIVTGGMEVIHAAIKGLVVGVTPGSA